MCDWTRVMAGLLTVALLSGSACTHQKVRISQASDTQLSCAALRNELARVEQSRAEIDSKTGFSDRNVGMALVFWPGVIVNESQAASAEAAAVARLDRLNQLYYDTQAMPDLYPDWWQAYPARWDVLIEHENGNYPEEELYKLLMRRAPLKVLIFYDWGVFAQEGRPGRQQWFPEKLKDLFRIGRTVAGHQPEAENTEYLLLVGQAEQEGGPHRWRYLCVQGGCWPEQPSKPQALSEFESNSLI